MISPKKPAVCKVFLGAYFFSEDSGSCVSVCYGGMEYQSDQAFITKHHILNGLNSPMCRLPTLSQRDWGQDVPGWLLPRVGWDNVPLASPWLVDDHLQLHMACSLCACLWVQISFSCEDTSHVGVGLTLRTSMGCNHCCKDPSLNKVTLRGVRELGHQHLNLGGHNSTCNKCVSEDWHLPTMAFLWCRQEHQGALQIWRWTDV